MRLTISAILAALCVTVCFFPAAAGAAAPSGGVIHACMLTKSKKATRGLLRVVPAAKACKKRKGEKPLEWSVAGPAGQPDAPGSAATLDKAVTETLANQAQQIR